ncbi:MAG: TolC family protein [Deltaproteobacteria bacterium]|nr:TolC family protein [Deltaproteobacteria bacterium]
MNKKKRRSLPVEGWIKIFIFWLGILVAFPNAHSLMAMTDSDRQLLKLFQEEEPEIFSRSKLVSERDRQLLEISLGDILTLVKNRSITLQASVMGEKAVQSQLILAEQPNRSQLTTTIQQLKSASLSGTDLKQSSVSPYLTSTSTDQTLISATWSKKNKLGMLFSTSLEKYTRQTKVFTMAAKNDALSGGTPTDDPLEAATLSLGVSVPIFQDWGDVNQVLEKRAEIAVAQSRFSTDGTEIGLLESVAKTYWTLVGIRQNIKTLEEAVKLSAQLVKETGARVDVGILNYTDLKEAETQLASNQQSLLSAQISEQEIEDQIRVALNLENVSFGFKPADIPSIHREPLDFKKLLQKSYHNSVQINKLQASLKANSIDLGEAVNLDKTNLDLSFQYSFSGYGASSAESLQVFDKSQLQGYVLGVTWTVPLFDKITPEKISQVKIKRSQLELQLRDAKSQLAINLQTVLRNLHFGLEEEKNAILSKELAKDLMEKEIEKLKIGKSTGYNVSLVQQKYTSASYVEVLVRVRNEQNFIALLALTGDLYSRYNLPRRN